MANPKTNDSKANEAAAEPPSAAGLGRCCYGGVKPKTACGSCAAWSDVDFATTLAAQQLPLGREFAEVLHENLWDLYESAGR